MAKDSDTLMVLVSPYAGFAPGARLLANDPLVKACPGLWVPFSEGDRAVLRRRAELEVERNTANEKHRADERAERMSQGTRILPSDDAIAAAAKKSAQMDKRLELAFDEAGNVIGVKEKSAATTTATPSGYVGD